MEMSNVVKCLAILGFDLFETIDPQEAAEALGDKGSDDTYALIGQTDQGTTYGLFTDDAERAEIVLCEAGAHKEVLSLLRALGWREVPDHYVQSKAFYVPS